MSAINEGIAPGDIVRPKWGQRSGRWKVLRTRHSSWEGAILVRCLVVPRTRKKRRTWWSVGQQGWVRFMFEVVP